jgi:hemolysin type calcium-binding protein
LRKEIAAVVAVGVATALSPALAQAANVTAPEPAAGAARVLTYAAVAGETNQPTFTREGANVVVRDPSVTLVAAAPCAAPDIHTVVCPDAPTRITQVVATLDDMPDSAVVGITDVTTNLNGGPGKDVITGSDGGADVIDGAGDEDAANGRGGDDTLLDGIADAAPNHLFAGAGDDVMRGGSGPDQIDGGEGFDTFTYNDRGPDAASGVSVALAGGAATGAGAPGENDTLAAIENLQGTAKNDTLVGDDGANTIQGLDGDDTITGGQGSDLLSGGGGKDTIDALDQTFDRVSCGGPQAGDTASVDDIDQAGGCPAAGAGLSVTPVPAAVAPDQTAPRVGITYTKVMKVRTFRRRGATLTVFSSDKTIQNTVTAEMLGRVRSVKSFSKAAVGDLLLASRSARFAAKKKLTLKPSKRYRAHLRKGQRIRLRVTITDQARNRATKIVTIRLK